MARFGQRLRMFGQQSAVFILGILNKTIRKLNSRDGYCALAKKASSYVHYVIQNFGNINAGA